MQEASSLPTRALESRNPPSHSLSPCYRSPLVCPRPRPARLHVQFAPTNSGGRTLSLSLSLCVSIPLDLLLLLLTFIASRRAMVVYVMCWTCKSFLLSLSLSLSPPYCLPSHELGAEPVHSSSRRAGRRFSSRTCLGSFHSVLSKTAQSLLKQNPDAKELKGFFDVVQVLV